MTRSPWILPLLAAALALQPGCRSPSAQSLEDLGPAFEPVNVRGPAQWPLELRRVAVLPVADGTGDLPTAFVASYDQPWLQALQASQRVEFVPVDRSTYARWTGGGGAWPSTGILPADWAARLRATTGADAALLTDITHCSPYPPLALGLRAKLVRLDTGEIIWSVDELLDASDPRVARGARRHVGHLAGTRAADAAAVLQSPSRFAAYVATLLADTLPPR